MRCTVTDLQNTQGCGASFDKDCSVDTDFKKQCRDNKNYFKAIVDLKLFFTNNVGIHQKKIQNIHFIISYQIIRSVR